MDSSNNKSDPPDLYQISLLIDQLRHDDAQMRISATKHLGSIAEALGPERTRDELIPFIAESVDDEDDVILAIAENIGDFFPEGQQSVLTRGAGELKNYVGGKEYYFTLLEPIELLAIVEEAAVREAAVKAVEPVIEGMPDDDLLTYFVPFVQKLAGKDWFTSRISVTSLFHIAYKRLPLNVQKDFRTMYIKLCSDDTPMVRRMSAQHFGGFCALLAPNEIEDFLEPFKKIAVDDQDSVRIQTVGICIALAEALPSEVKMGEVLPVILAIAADRSWRVRWSLAVKIADVSGVMGNQVANNSLCECFENLLRDSEAEVRSAAAGNISKMCSRIRKDVMIDRVLPIVNQIVTDSSDHARAACAAVINDLASLLGRDGTVEQLLPMLLQLLRDESSDVRLNIIANLDAINAVIGVELLSQSLLPAIVDLAEDSKWRVRHAIIEHIPSIAKQLGCTFFNEKLNNLCMTWLGDDVYSIRRAAANNLCMLAAQFGEEWTKEQIIPRIERMHSHTNYLQRMTALYGIQVLVANLSQPTVEDVIMPIIVRMSSDSVPNVRLNVARTLQDIVTHTGSKFRGNFLEKCVAPTLSSLAEDSDTDVRFYSAQASEKMIAITSGTQ